MIFPHQSLLLPGGTLELDLFAFPVCQWEVFVFVK